MFHGKPTKKLEFEDSWHKHDPDIFTTHEPDFRITSTLFNY